MVYRRSRSNVRKPVRRRAPARRRLRRTFNRSSKRQGYARQQKPCVCPGELSPTAKFALAQLDPFHPDALGAKVPDSNTMPSIANAATDQVSCVAAGTTGWLTGFAFRPQYNQAVINATPVSGTAVSWGANATVNAVDRRDVTTMRAAFEAIRPVAHAIRLVSPLAPTSATGFVHIGLSVESYYNSPASTWQFPTSVNEMTGLAFYKRLTLASLTQSPITAINKWIDERAFQYADTTQLAGITNLAAPEISNPFGWSWCTIVVLIEGSPATSSPLSAEHLLLSEALPKKDGVLIGTQAASNSPGTMSSVSTMSAQQEFTHTEAGQEGYMQQGLQSLYNGAAQQGEQVMNNIAIPLITRLGRAAVNSGAAYIAQAIAGRGGIPGVNANQRLLLS